MVAVLPCRDLMMDHLHRVFNKTPSPDAVRQKVSRLLMATLLGVTIVGINVVARPLPPKPFRICLSVSPFAEMMFDQGFVFGDGKMTAHEAGELQSIFVRRSEEHTSE